MFVRIRTRLIVSSVVTVALLLGLVVFLVLERVSSTGASADQADLEQAARRARDLSLFVQADIHAVLAYQLGQLDHRKSFLISANGMAAALRTLERAAAGGRLDPRMGPELDRFRVLATQHNLAAQEAFDAADRARRENSSAAVDDAARLADVSDRLAERMDVQADRIVLLLDTQAQALRETLAARYRLVTWLVVGLGLVLALLILLIQLIGQRALGRPLRDLLAGVRQLSQGALETRIPVRAQDELGVLAGAFNDMAARLQRQTETLQLQTAAAEQARAEAEQARNSAAAQLAMIAQQREIIREMSVPILPLSNATLVMPLVGAMDTDRLRLVQDQALHRIEQFAARYLILDITGIPIVDTAVAQGLIQVIEAARLLGAEVVLVGIRPEIAQAMVGLGIDLGAVVTRSSLQGGIAYTKQ